MAPSRDEVLSALARVIDPELRRSVVELDMVRSVEIEDGEVALTIALTVAGCPLRADFQQQVDREVGSLPGIRAVTLSFDVMTPEEKAALTTRLRGGVTERTKGVSIDASTRVLAVCSGKGGVGKSSLTVNLAAAFSALGLQTGVLDADVYGYSIPGMLGIHQRPIAVDQMIVPPVRGDLKVMSIGFFLDDNAPVMWRGPMLHRALEQFLSDVHWGELDWLVVDMPPGTGDVSISLGQLLPRAEVIVVTTPQRAAQEVAVRAAEMARKTNMRLLGVVENMSYLVGTGQAIFGEGGGETLASALGVPLLGAASRSIRRSARPPTWVIPSCCASPRPSPVRRSRRSPRRSWQSRARPESASRRRCRSCRPGDDAAGCRRRPLAPAQLLEDDRVDSRDAVHAFLEVLDARPGLEVAGEIACLESQPGESLAQLVLEARADRDPVLLRCLAEVELVEPVEPFELRDRGRVVVHPQVDQNAAAVVAASLAHDVERGGLLAAAVASRLLSRRQGGEQAFCERGSGRPFEDVRERGHGGRGDEEVSLGRIARADLVPGPCQAAAARVGGRAAFRVDDTELPVGPPAVGRRQPLHDIGGGRPLAEHGEAVRPVADLRQGLSGDGAGARGGPDDDRADGEELGLDSDAPFPALAVAGDDRVGRDDQSSIVWPGSMSTISTSGASSRT